jgi:hypothetical protein
MEPMENEFQEYATFVVTTRDGSKAELAVVDEFEFENKQYVVGALIEGDVINDDARYIYEADVKDDELVVKKIAKEFDYNRIANAYLHMED